MDLIITNTITTALASIAMLGVVAATSPADAASTCKGLDQPTCGGIATCKWQPGITAGEAGPRGNIYKATRKAHCRAGVRTPDTSAVPKKTVDG
jgi:hypothetical protein